MARYWVGDAGEHEARDADAPATRSVPAPGAAERERLADAVRRTLAGNVTDDDGVE